MDVNPYNSQGGNWEMRDGITTNARKKRGLADRLVEEMMSGSGPVLIST
jgi:hypothetical protein